VLVLISTCAIYVLVLWANLMQFTVAIYPRHLTLTRSSATAKSTGRPSCLVGILYDIYRRQKQQINS